MSIADDIKLISDCHPSEGDVADAIARLACVAEFHSEFRWTKTDEFRSPAEARAWEVAFERRIVSGDNVTAAKRFAYEYIRGWREAMDPLEPPARRDLLAAIEVAAEEITVLASLLEQALSDSAKILEFPERPNLAKFLAFAVMVRSKGPSA